MVGDIVGKPGRKVLRRVLPELRRELALDFVVVNGENAAAGFGLTEGTADEIFDAGANVVLEAMSCGLPVIVSDRCGTDELVNDGGNGYVLPVVGKSIDGQWNDAIGQLVDDPALRGRLGIAARGTAEQHTFSDYVVTFERLLGEVLQQKCNTD